MVMCPKDGGGERNLGWKSVSNFIPEFSHLKTSKNTLSHIVSKDQNLGNSLVKWFWLLKSQSSCHLLKASTKAEKSPHKSTHRDVVTRLQFFTFYFITSQETDNYFAVWMVKQITILERELVTNKVWLSGDGNLWRHLGACLGLWFILLQKSFGLQLMNQHLYVPTSFRIVQIVIMGIWSWKAVEMIFNPRFHGLLGK